MITSSSTGVGKIFLQTISKTYCMQSALQDQDAGCAHDNTIKDSQGERNNTSIIANNNNNVSLHLSNLYRNVMNARACG